MEPSYYGTMDSAAAEGMFAALGAILGMFFLIFSVICVIMIIANWKIFTKAGKPGWASIVPFYNCYVLFEVAGMSGWMFLLLCIPFVNLVILIMLLINLAKAFGQGTGFAVGLIFLNPIFMLILAFGDSTYALNK